MTSHRLTFAAGRRASRARRISRLSLLLASLFVISVSLVVAGTAPVIGPPDDPYVIGAPRPAVEALSADEQAVVTQIEAMYGTVAKSDTVRISQLDPHAFPHVCAYVDALDSNGNPIGALTADSFCVWQDANRINSFSVSPLTLDSCITSVCLVIDVSGSMSDQHKIDSAKAAANRLVDKMDIYDRMAIVKFSDCYTLVQAFTSNKTTLHSKINALTAGGYTAAFDGIWEGVTVTTTELGSKAVIALSDGMENNSQNCGNKKTTPDGLPDGFADDSTMIVSLARGAGIPIYTISLGSSFDPQYLQKLAAGSGGSYHHAPSGAQLDSIYTTVKQRLCQRYLVCYNSPDTVANGDCHLVKVCHKRPNGDCRPCDTARYCETAPPVIRRTPATIALDTTCKLWGSAVPLCAWVTDRDTPANSLEVKLFYRNTNAAPYTSVLMSRTDSLFCYTIPGSEVPAGTDSVQYYITASDHRVTVSSPTSAPLGHHAVPICGNHPPVCYAPRDTTIFQCTPAQVCLPAYATDPDNNLLGCAVTSGPGQIIGGNWCYTPTGDQTVNVTIRCTDSVGAYCEKSFAATFTINDPPVCHLPNDTTIFQCTAAQVCLPAYATDADGNLTGCQKTSGPGSLNGGNWCYTPSGDETVTVTVRCTDACGAYCEKTFHVTFVINDPPVCNLPNDTTIFQCTPTQVCLPASATDPNGNLTGCQITNGPGTLNGGNWCYTPTGDQTVNVTIRCSDACGASCEKTFSVTFIINDPPVCNLPNDTTIFQCTPIQVCLPASATDPDGNLTGCQKTSGPGSLNGGNWCYTPAGDETVTVTIRCTDVCGAYCEKTFHVTFQINDPPVCHLPNDTTIFQCTPAQVCLPAYATDPDGNLTACQKTSGPGSLNGGNWCYTPSGDEAVTVTVRCTDACGVYCEKTFHVTFVINDPPVCHLPNDTTIFQCTPAQVCLPAYATDPDGNLTGCQITNGPGTLNGGNWCYTPTGDQTANVTIRCTDACGAYCEKTFHVTFLINDPPVCTVPNDTTIFQCTPVQVCLPVSATDADGNLTGCQITVGPGALNGGNWCYTPTGDQTVTVTVRCTDACGAYCEKTFHVTFVINHPPVCHLPNDTTIFQCVPAQVCLPAYATDPDGNLTGCQKTSGPGTLNGGNWCYTPTGNQTVAVTIRCTDACGAYCEKTFHVTFVINDPPVCNLPNDTTIFQCTPTQVCLPASATDPNGNLTGCQKTSGPGTLNGGNWCYTPSGDETVTVTVRCTDACGAYCEKTFHITFVINDPPVCNVPNDTTIFQCDPAQVCLPVSATDPNGNLTGCQKTSGPGALNGGNWCYTPTGDQTVTVTIRCTDVCGAYCEKTFHVTFQINDAPVCQYQTPSPPQCTPPVFVLPFTVTDGDNNLDTCILYGPGTLSDHVYSYIPTGGETINVIIRSYDDCQDSCTIAFSVTFPVKQPPTCNIPRDTTIFHCAPTQVCLPVSGTSINPPVACAVTGGPGTVVGGNWCYTPSGDETATVTIRCTDACGLYCEDSFDFTYIVNDSPELAFGNDSSLYRRVPPEPICLIYAVSDPNGPSHLTETLISGPAGATIDTAANSVCFTPPDVGDYTVIAQVTDSCGLSDRDTVIVHVVGSPPPSCHLPNDTTIFQCTPVQVCLPASATGDHPPIVCAVVSGPGQVQGGNWCYTPAGNEVAQVTIRCTDALGISCEGSFTVTFTINNPPVCNLPGDTTIFQCTPTQVCLPASATDPDGNLVGCQKTSGPGSLNGGWCYTPAGDETVTVTIRCTDSCGAYCEKTFHVTFIINDPPVCHLPNDTTIFQCTPAQVCLPAYATDPDGNLNGCQKTSGPGALNGGNWCYTPAGDETVTVTIRCTDSCGAYCEKTFHATFIINDPPVCHLPNDSTIFRCTAAQVCLPAYATDADGNLTGCQITNGPGSLNGGNWCYTPAGDETVTVTIRCTDGCGVYCEKTFHVTFVINDPPVCHLPNDTTIFQCTPAQVCLPAYATDADGNLTGCQITNGPGTLNGGNWCYTPTGDQTANVTIRCTDACGAYCEKSFAVTFAANTPPVCHGQSDTTVFQCIAHEERLHVWADDPNGNLVGCQLVSGPGQLISAGWYYDWCYTPPGDTSVTVTVRCTDSCGVYCEKTFHATFVINDPPVIAFGSDTSVFLCTHGEQVCIPYTLTDPQGPGGLHVTLLSAPAGATIDSVGHKVCFTPTDDGHFFIIALVKDPCGTGSADVVEGTVTFNRGPYVDFGPDLTVFQCSPASICVNYTVSDPDGLRGVIEGLSYGPPGATIDTAANKVCFTPTTSNQYRIDVRATDSCGLSDLRAVYVNVTLNSPPTIAFGNDQTIFQCTPSQMCASYTVSDPNGLAKLVETLVAGPAGAAIDTAGNKVCFTPSAAGTYTIIARVTDSCGANDLDTIVYNVALNSPPTIAFGSDQTVFQGAPAPICAPYVVSDPDGLAGLVETLISGPAGATIDTAQNKVCFTPPSSGVYTIIAEVTDPCNTGGAKGSSPCTSCDLDTIVFTVTINSPPTISLGGDLNLFQCNPQPACVNYTVSDPNGLAGLTETLVSGPAGTTIDTALNKICFTPAASGTFAIIAKVADPYGGTDFDTVNVTIGLNAAPVCQLPRDTTLFQCTPATVCFPVSATDADNNLTSCQKISGPGQLINGNWCYTPAGDEVAQVTIRCTDACGAFCERSFTITFDVNDPPVCVVPSDTLIRQNCVPQTIFLPVTATDEEQNLVGCELISGPGELVNGRWTYTPSGDETVCVTFACTDACGASCQKQFCVHITVDEDNCGCRLMISVGGDDGATHVLNGTQMEVPVRIDSLSAEIGGFDLLLCYDPTVVSFLGAHSGALLDSLRWEYFTYRHGPFSNCGGGCPSGYIRLVGIANLDNGVTPPADAYHPIGVIANLLFQATTDRNFIGQCAPIRFCWLDCTDNTVADREGDTTFVERNLQYDTCQSNPKVNPIPGICFFSGLICIDEPKDDRGDMNLNAIANEVGDAVLFTNYFIYGDVVWSDVCLENPHRCYKDIQILASDVNDDGIVLTVADLIYMIRIITGDAEPFPKGGNPKLSPYVNSATATYRVENGALHISTASPVDLGGAAFVFRYNGMGLGEPVLSAAASGLKVQSSARNGELRVLVYPDAAKLASVSAGTNEIVSIPTAGEGTIELVDVQMSDTYGALLSSNAAKVGPPKEYALLQNYPNPFNAGTVIGFNLREPADWRLTIYNITGQVVRAFSGQDGAAHIQVPWDGADQDGNAVASGVYFYRLKAGSFTATRKMTLVK